MSKSEEAKYFVGLIINRNQFNCINNKGYTYYNAKFLRDSFGRYSCVGRPWKYTDILKELDGIVEIEPKWWNGVKGRSKGFKLTSEYENTKVIGYRMPNCKFTKKVLKINEKKSKKEELYKIITDDDGICTFNEITAVDITKNVSKNFIDRNIIRIGIKKEEALAYLNNPDNIKEIIKRNEATRSKKLPKQSEVEVWNHYFIAIDKMSKGLYSSTKESRTGRYYNNISNLPRELRQFIFEKEKVSDNLIELDLKNSQPFFIVKLIREFKEKGKGGKEGREERKEENRIKKSLCCDILKNLPKDTQKYIKLVCDAKIYEYFMPILGIPDDKRDEFKIMFYKSFFFCNPNNCNREILKVFKDDFPHVLRIIRYYKSFECREVQKIDEDIKKGEKGIHCNFIRRLQRIESDLIINKVIRRIAKEKGDIFAVTIHDSIICSESDADYVENVLNEELMNEYGMVPQIGKKMIATNEVKMEKAG
ncbi:MAG: hypothetical protein NTY74_04820 [Ignavibacteriae bacterium]|nr:hypothetical protein [Ignavibacteriota bacterium]